ncbi:MAG: class I SAM-dependent methyltransferase [Armatimonadetes bacterium]|nr:MAG: class I SAM-dependent methyltransferase [Armatimonadota bacterium]
MISAILRDKQFRFETKSGLFSKDTIDIGSRLLIDKMNISITDVVLDLGCGYGAIGLVAAYLASQGRVWMVDTDIRAIKYSKINAKLNGIPNVEVVDSDGFENVPSDMIFNVILSNPPSHQPKETVIEFIEQAKMRLKDKGKIYFVTENRIRPMIKREFERVFENYELLATSKQYAISLAVKQVLV